MDIRPVNDQKTWDGFVASRPFSQFLQSWSWGNFQQSLERPVGRLGLFDGDKLIGGAEIVMMRLPFGQRYYYVPRGPILDDPTSTSKLCQLQRGLFELVERKPALAIRVEPPIETEGHEHVCPDLGYHRVRDVQPRVTRVVDLTRSIDQLRAELHPKTRYNIGLAERKGVTIQDRTNDDGLKIFLELQRVTAERDGITTFPDGYYQAMYQSLKPAGQFRIMTAEHEGKPLAASLMIRYGDTVTYNHGASSDEARNLMAPHLLQWKAIEQAKADGFKIYDFRGIAPTEDPKHPWAGITRFKAGFGGRIVRLIGTYDLALERGKYATYRTAQFVVQRIRNIMR